MSRDVLTAGSTMRIPLLYRGEYSQWVERFMNYIEEQTDGEAMINSIKNGDQPLPRVTQVSIAGTSSTEQPLLKDKSMWHMLGFEYGEQDRKAAVLYEYKTFKATKEELLLDTCILPKQLTTRVETDATMMRQYKKLMDINIDALYNILKQNQGDVNDAMGSKKKTSVVTSDPLALIAEKMKVSKSKEKVVVFSDSEGKASSSSADEKIYEDLQDKYDVLKNQATIFEMNNKELNEKLKELIEKNNDLLAQTKKIVKCQKRIEKSNQQSKDFKNQNKDLQDKYDVLKNQATIFEMNNKELNEKLKELIEKNNDLLAQTKVLKDQLQVKHVVIDTHVECQEKYAKVETERYEYMIRYSAYFYNDKQHMEQIADQEVLYDKMSVQLVELDKHELVLKIRVILKKKKDLRPTLYDEKVIGLGCTPMFLTHSEEALEIEKFKRSRENKIEFAYDYEYLNASYVKEKINFKDDYFQEIINPDFEKIDSPFQQTSSLKPYVQNVILEKIIIDLEDEVVNLLEKEKANLETIESLKSKGFESSETVISESENQSENDCLVVEKECDKEENPKVIAPGMFKLSVSQSVLPISI
nr:Gag-Pol polyprotein [Tanacetum cinerariifolium]